MNRNYDEKCDIWSCGVILYILLCGYPPFNGANDDQILQKIKTGSHSYNDPIWDKVSSDAKDFINLMLNRNS